MVTGGFSHNCDVLNEDTRSVCSSIPGPLQTVQRAELWRVIFSFQAFLPVYIGVDNVNVFNFVSELLNGTEWFKPLPLQKDGDLIAFCPTHFGYKRQVHGQGCRGQRPCY